MFPLFPFLVCSSSSPASSPSSSYHRSKFFSVSTSLSERMSLFAVISHAFADACLSFACLPRIVFSLGLHCKQKCKSSPTHWNTTCLCLWMCVCESFLFDPHQSHDFFFILFFHHSPSCSSSWGRLALNDFAYFSFFLMSFISICFFFFSDSQLHGFDFIQILGDGGKAAEVVVSNW